MINEVATLFLVTIVFVAVLKNSLTLPLIGAVLGVFSVLLVGGFVIYQQVRRRAAQAPPVGLDGS